MDMTKAELLKRLQEAVTWKEWKGLESDPDFPISKYNREFLLEMKQAEIKEKKRISMNQILKLRKLLRDFLAEYMADKPQWWKWIIMACIYLTYVAERPMHPIEVVGAKTEIVDGKTTYKCPMKSKEKGTVCDYCVCEYLEEGEEA